VSKAWDDAHPAYHYNRRRDPKLWASRTIGFIKGRAKTRGIPFNITAEDIPLPAVCPFTLLPFDMSADKMGVPRAQSPSVDRIKPELGYVRGNVRVISLQANVARSNITDPEIFRRLYEDALIWSLV
jgi:hypothetical protein